MDLGKPDRNFHEKESNSYAHNQLEEKWQTRWSQKGLYKTIEPRENQKTFYALSMFPYPSGSLHMGHVRNYVITDVIARFHRMNGKAVLHPMGWDAFGLPAENAAIERGIEPDEWTFKNIDQMKAQLKKLGLSIDWDKEFRTCEENYYKWTQHLFLELYNEGLAYQKEATVNWDPIDNTVLANEQVDSEGRSWRSGALVEKKQLKQWFLKITEYADELLEDLNLLKGWPENVKTMQSNWIGKSIGTEIEFNIYEANSTVKVFTTRVDTLGGANYIVLAPDHKLVKTLLLAEYQESFIKLTERINRLSEQERISDRKEKNGIFTGSYAINPLNNKKIPIWIGDYVLSSYATGAVMGVPGHDLRDFNFAQKYDLPITYVIKNPKSVNNIDKPNLEKGELINSGIFNGLHSDNAIENIIEKGENEGWAIKKVSFKLRDWLISRQRYWGCPIPIIHCNECGTIPYPQEFLPLKLNKNMDSTIRCFKCNNIAEIETDTMDTFMCSSWYYLRYIDSNNTSKPFDSEKINKWMPVNQYVGGIEHAILHLLYSRFFIKALHSKGLLNIKEPFENLLTQGMVQAVTYKNPRSNKYIPSNLVKDKSNPIDPDTGEKLDILFEKMSKSKYNGVDPKDVINSYGTDTARMFVLFKAPPEKDLEWDESDVEGQFRFLNKIWRLFNQVEERNDFKFSNSIISNKTFRSDEFNDADRKLIRAVNNTIKQVTHDLENNSQFNTAISELMILCNCISDHRNTAGPQSINEALLTLTLLLAPFAPHLAEELWAKFTNKESVHLQGWPSYEPSALIETSYELVIQINGKKRGSITVSREEDNKHLEEKALKSDITKKWLRGKTPRRIIVVKGKLVNIVI